MQKTGTLWPSLLLLLLAVGLLLDTKTAVEAVRTALWLWWSSIVPTLLPFFLVSRLLIGLGLAEQAGRCFAPLMKPLFDLPGSAALGVLLGFCSGFPTGAAVTAGLRRRGLLDSEQGARLLAFTNNAGVMYVTATVAAGLLQQPRYGTLLLLAHYGSDLLLGIALGQHSRRRKQHGARQASLPGSAAETMAETTAETPARSAQLLTECAADSIRSLLLIACYMCLFSLPLPLLRHLLSGLGISLPPLLSFLFSGALEMSLGMQALAGCRLSPPLLTALAAAQLSFGGLSVQAQVGSMVADTDIDLRLYRRCRWLQAALSAALVRLLLPLFTLPAVNAAATTPQSAAPQLNSWAAALFFLLLWSGAALFSRSLPKTSRHDKTAQTKV